MIDVAQLKRRTRCDYGFTLQYRTRWNDNDMYGHVNNSVYNFMIDSIVNAYLIEFANLQPGAGASSQRGLVVQSHTDYFGPISYPAVVELGLGVSSIGKSSVTYEVGVFEKGVAEVKAVGAMVHVFVESKGGKPAAEGMQRSIRDALGRILVGSPGGKL